MLDNDSAIEDYSKAIEIDPDYAEAYNNRGFVYDVMGEYGQAIDDFNKAIELVPDYAKAYYNRGVTYVKQGRNDEALADFEKALAYSNSQGLTKMAQQRIEELSG